MNFNSSNKSVKFVSPVIKKITKINIPVKSNSNDYEEIDYSFLPEEQEEPIGPQYINMNELLKKNSVLNEKNQQLMKDSLLFSNIVKTEMLLNDLSNVEINNYINKRSNVVDSFVKEFEDVANDKDMLMMYAGIGAIGQFLPEDNIYGFLYSSQFRLLYTYKDFLSYLTTEVCHMGDLGSYIPQGLCSVNGYTIVSAYKKEGTPKVLIIDSNGEKNWVSIDLPDNTHVGGMTYDPINNNFWITGANGEVGVYSYDSIMNNNGESAKAIQSFDVNLKNDEDTKVASYMTYYDGKLYVGSFRQEENGTIREFEIANDGVTLKETNSFSVPKEVQGVTFCEKNGKTYMATSCSHGRENDSRLNIFNYDENKKEYSVEEAEQIILPPLLEQINFDENGNIKAVFESNAEEYSDALVRIPSICTLDVSSCLK